MKKCAKTAWTIDENDQLCTLEQGDTQCDAYTVEAFSIEEALQQALCLLKKAEAEVKFQRARHDSAQHKIDGLNLRVREIEAKERDFSAHGIPHRRPMNLSPIEMVKSIRDDLDISLVDAKHLVDYIFPADSQTVNEHNVALNGVRDLINH